MPKSCIFDSKSSTEMQQQQQPNKRFLETCIYLALTLLLMGKDISTGDGFIWSKNVLKEVRNDLKSFLADLKTAMMMNELVKTHIPVSWSCYITLNWKYCKCACATS